MSLFYDLLFFAILFFKYIGIPVGLILLITWCIIKCIREAKKTQNTSENQSKSRF